MFGYVKGIFRARKLAKSVDKLTQRVVNHLILRGIRIRLPDTAWILKESYAFCSCIRLKKASIEEHGMTAVLAMSLLRDSLIANFQPCYPEFDFEEGVDSVMKSLPNYFKTWTSQLATDYPELVGKPMTQIIHFAGLKYAKSIREHILENYLFESDEFDEFLVRTVNDCIAEVPSGRMT